MSEDNDATHPPEDEHCDAGTGESGSPLQGRHRRHQFPGRPYRLTPRFSTEEMAEIVVAAASVGLTATGFCADAVLAAARGEHLAFGAVQDREALAVLQRRLFEATAEVNRIGVNLNQAVAAFNATGRTPVWLGRAVLTCEMTITKLDVLAVEIDRRLR